MAAFTSGVSRVLLGLEANPVKGFLQQQRILINSRRSNFIFKHLAERTQHNENYEYEVSKDPKEWAIVEKLLPLTTVPVPEIKSHYPSGWRPMKEEALNLPYFVERTRNYMLPVFLHTSRKTLETKTSISKIHGDFWSLFEDLEKHLEEQLGEKILSYAQEGNSKIFFKGDVVYHVEQWLLKKGF
ncbi:hypothetical protein RUM44_013704 [Polyplax serrata]|uniref:Large ribosomal subunit protein mL49 n=1 Tax=Polyplax serrata TaxID=468196 RepID=A0ABR1BEY1_POLSC